MRNCVKEEEDKILTIKNLNSVIEKEMKDITVRRAILPRIFLFLLFLLILFAGTFVIYKGKALAEDETGKKDLAFFSFIGKYDEKKEQTEKTASLNAVPPKSKKLLLAVGVLNKLSMVARRDAIRLTWFRQCKQNPSIVQCRFFTDESTNSTEKQIYEDENDSNGDMLFMPIKGIK